ncbi:MAG: LacI family DNA-binding transcriptional regulator [Capsulimonadaceae bacterium]|nr:LacI family DNA-binding transcriptional regulator [Capsulimonadaceae bacterium]
MADIAEKAGVSVSTVSLVLSGKAKTVALSDAVIQRVSETASRLDYSPNLLMQNMQTGESHLLTIFNCFRYIPHIEDVFGMRLMTAIFRAAGALGYDVTTVCHFSQSSEETYHSLNGGRSDGVILFAPQRDDELLARFRVSRMPAVMLYTSDPEGILSSVRDDVEEGMRLIAERLCILGHRRIAVIDEGQDNPNAPERIALLRWHAARLGMDLPQSRIVQVGYSEENTFRAVESLMAGSARPTAIFCWQNMPASLVASHCERIGFRVPADVSVIGYDGLEWPGLTHHRVASVNVDLDDVARRAVRILDDKCAGRPCALVDNKVPVQFSDGTTLSVAP